MNTTSINDVNDVSDVREYTAANTTQDTTAQGHTTKGPKRRVYLLYGGPSPEHEVSCRSAAFVYKWLNRERYSVQAVYITQGGHWCLVDPSSSDCDVEQSLPQVASKHAHPVHSIAEFTQHVGQHLPVSDQAHSPVVISMVHGRFGEDGCYQGFIQSLGLDYTGCGVAASALSLDKIRCKMVLEQSGLPVTPYLWLSRHDWQQNQDVCLARIAELEHRPLFVKPSRTGSSVGVSRVDAFEQLSEAITSAFQHDDEILIEHGLNIREIECAVIGYKEPKVSLPGEVIVHGEQAKFYSYAAKYTSQTAAESKIPADLPSDLVEKARHIAADTYKALGLDGYARVDLFYASESKTFYVNEVNTLPGFTSISQFPLLWRHHGVSESALLEQLIEHARVRTASRAP